MNPKSIHHACHHGDLNTVKSLVADNPACVDADDENQWRPIFHAALRKYLDIVKLLIESGADLSAHNGDVLHYAAEVPDNKEVVALLIQYGALHAHVRPTTELMRQFLAALFLGDASRVQSLIQLHPGLAADSDGRGDCPIHHAARNGDTDIVRLLIDHGADVNVSNKRGHTVLYCAAGHGHAESVELLLECGADSTTKFTKDGKAILEWLAQYPDDTRLAAVARIIGDYE